MTTSATPKKTTTRAAKPRVTRKRAVKKNSTAVESQPKDADQTVQSGPTQRLRPSSQSEQLIILVGALTFGLVGLLVHFLWIVSILLMALLLGLIAAEVRSVRGRGIVSEVVNEAKVVVGELKLPGTNDREGPESDGEPSSSDT